jgi:hypothetical protein
MEKSTHNDIYTHTLAVAKNRRTLSFFLLLLLFLLFLIVCANIPFPCILVEHMQERETIRWSSNQTRRVLRHARIRVGKEQWKKKKIDQSRIEKREQICLLSLLTNTLNVYRYMVIFIVTSMNRQLFSEVFKQISSKIDQLKNFPSSTAHLKVKKNREKTNKYIILICQGKKSASGIYISNLFTQEIKTTKKLLFISSYFTKRIKINLNMFHSNAYNLCHTSRFHQTYSPSGQSRQ